MLNDADEIRTDQLRTPYRPQNVEQRSSNAKPIVRSRWWMDEGLPRNPHCESSDGQATDDDEIRNREIDRDMQ